MRSIFFDFYNFLTNTVDVTFRQPKAGIHGLFFTSHQKLSGYPKSMRYFGENNHFGVMPVSGNVKLCVLLMFIGIVSNAQQLRISRTDIPVVIDARMDDPVWQEADIASHFMQSFPYDSSEAIAQTEVRMAYDNDFIYVIAKMKNNGPRKYVTPSLRRDFRGQAFDSFSVILDTYQDKTNAFLFGINPFGVQREGLISGGGGGAGGGGGGGRGGSGGSSIFSLSWDNKWYSEARVAEDYWMVEMAIPFKSIRFKEGLSAWYINFYRIDSHTGERSTWSPIPRNFSIINLAFSQELIWDNPLSNPGSNISLIPYAALTTSKDFGEGLPSETTFTAGGDAKVALTPALNLDLTINPDFSQVEVDRQVTNLDRFEIFFPERRQFFLENADLFASFGSSGTRPFFSRRIGIALDTATGQNIQNQLYFGARVSGKIDNNWRIGLMSVQAAQENDIFLPSTNYTVVSVQRKVLARSNIAMLFVNKQAFQDSIGADFTFSPMAYNRVLGLDFNLATADNKWNGKVYYHRSFDNEKPDSAFAAGAQINMGTYRWEFRATMRNTGANYNPEMGFVRRKDIVQLAPTLWYNLYPSSGSIQSHGPGFDFDMVGNQKYGFLDWDVNMMYRINFRSTARFNMRLRREYTYLFEPFDPSGSGGRDLDADTEYYNNLIIASFSSDQRNSFFITISTRSGEYFNGTRLNFSGELTYRYQPIGFASINFTYNRIRLPEPYNDANLYLVGPRIDFTFTRKIFWTTFIQYNNQINNVNINSRIQWRYKPVSDLFIVYTDNYLAGTDGKFVDFSQPKSRALVIKLTYWLNL